MAREKGKIAEREVAALLQAWWQPIEPGALFVRTPGSGGWQVPKVRAEFKAAGDIMTTAARFPWCVEVKRREGWSWTTLMSNRPSPIWKWWEQSKKDARVVALAPMLWFRHNREPWAIVLQDEPAGVAERWLLRLNRGVVVMRAEGLLAVPPATLLQSGP